MKSTSASLRVELAQYRELESFAQFGSELDKDTLTRLEHGKRIVEILKQPQYQPMSMQDQVMILYATTHRFLEDVPVDRLLDFEKEFIPYAAAQHPKIALNIANEKKLSDETAAELEQALTQFKEIFMGGNA